MRAIVSPHIVLFGLFSLLVLMVPGPASPSIQCPSGTTPVPSTAPSTIQNLCCATLSGSQCTLSQGQTLEPQSGDTIDCGGLTLMATQKGTGIDWPSARSNPEVAIFVHDVYGVTIQNCTIQDFDFGIYAINGKAPLGSHHISNNIITARFLAISLMGVDNTTITGNTLTYTTQGGSGLYIGRHSNSNRIGDTAPGLLNTITANFSSPPVQCPTNPSPSYPPIIGALRAPGPATPIPVVGPPGKMRQDPTSLSSNPCTYNTGAVVITELQGSDPTLLNVMVNGTPYQLIEPTITQSSPQDFSAGNMFIGNQITVPTNESGLILNNSQMTTVSNNTITGASASIRAGGATAPRHFPSQCFFTGRWCLQNVDCTFPGSGFPAWFWSCGTPPLIQTTWNTYNDTITSNRINAALSAVFGIVTLGDTMCIANNKITGMIDPTTGMVIPVKSGTGISLQGPLPLAPTTGAAIWGNTVDNFDKALGLIENGASMFGAQISLNSFTHYNTAVWTASSVPATQAYDLPSELSVDGTGNYWDKVDCSFAPNKVQDAFLNAVNPTVYVTDSHPTCAGQPQPINPCAQFFDHISLFPNVYWYR